MSDGERSDITKRAEVSRQRQRLARLNMPNRSEEGSFSTVRLDCPDGHAMLWLGVDSLGTGEVPTFWGDAGQKSSPVDRDGALVISIAGNGADRDGTHSHLAGHDAVASAFRWRIRCRKPRCRYSGVHTAEVLIELWASAGNDALPSVKVPR